MDDPPKNSSDAESGESESEDDERLRREGGEQNCYVDQDIERNARQDEGEESNENGTHEDIVDSDHTYTRKKTRSSSQIEHQLETEGYSKELVEEFKEAVRREEKQKGK